MLRERVIGIVFSLFLILLIPPVFAINKTVFVSPSSKVPESHAMQEYQTETQHIATFQVIIDVGAGTNVNSPGYTPDNLTVVLGVNNTVEWINRDDMPHTVTAVDGSYDSGYMPPNATFTHTFTQAAIYPYLCVYHHWMHGIVIALASGTAQTQQTQNGDNTSTPGSTVPEAYLEVAIGAIILAAVLIFGLRRTKHK